MYAILRLRNFRIFPQQTSRQNSHVIIDLNPLNKLLKNVVLKNLILRRQQAFLFSITWPFVDFGESEKRSPNFYFPRFSLFDHIF